MDCKVSIFVNDQIIHSHIEQQIISNACIYNLLNKAVSHGIEHRLNHYLFEMQGIYNPNENEAETLLDFKQINNLGYYWKSRIAIILDDPINDWHRQMESYFQGAGFALRMFTAKEPALEWLKSPYIPGQTFSLQ
ncbi:MAG: hypothetical protein H6667_25810 [Ardenticatenaceae bacterium]|nr:hypothetical protein [Ardenticatenaceae bacterium]MCB9445478.1 hypothetical protein [Ardenticatenaceae bacterium]